MKILFTSKGDNWDSPMDDRFGRSESFLLFDDKDNTLSFFDNSDKESMHHGAGLQASKKVMELVPDVIITGNGAGEKALAILKRSHVSMYTGAGDMSVQEAYEAFKNQNLTQQF